MLQDLKELAAKLQSQYQLTFNEGDRCLPESFKNLVRNIEGAQVEYFDHSFVVASTSKNKIYFPNQLWFVAAYFSDLYEALEQYASVIKSLALGDDIIKNCKGDLAYTNKVLSSVKNIENTDRDKLALFLSDYSWWGGGKGAERADYYYSPIISQCGLVNASQSYVAEMCRFLAKNPQAANILKAENEKSKPLVKAVSKELLFESRSIAEFMGMATSIYIKEDGLVSAQPSMKKNNVSVGFPKCSFGKLTTSFDTNTDARRKDDCDKNIIFTFNNDNYYFLKEQTFDTLTIFAQYMNRAYSNSYKIELESNVYRIFKLQSILENPVQHNDIELISNTSPYQFVWDCVKIFNSNNDLNKLFNSKYAEHRDGTVMSYMLINGCYAAAFGKSPSRETIKMCDGDYINAEFEARQVDKFADAVNDVFDGRYKITISDEDGKSVYRLLVLKFAEDKYLPYISALKTKPFMLLAGISGTGKSRIVRKMAKACWREGDAEYGKNYPSNFEMIQVKPNWHDSSELIGYVSRINGEKYVVGPFLRFMAKAIKNPTIPHFLCLDEMNLAPVEQYFAEYLSVIESRKMDEDGRIYTDPLIDFTETEAYGSLIDQLFEGSERKAYKTEQGGKRLCLPQNLFVVGTVNMDETTYSFSRKVLDRAMTIEMNEVDLNGGLDCKREHEFTYIPGNAIIGTAVEGCDVYSNNQTICNEVIDYLSKVNNKLENTPFKIAYRTRNEFLVYAVNRLQLSPDEDKSALLKAAMDEMTSMKILSRIEGERSKCVKPLEGIRDILKEIIPAEQQTNSVSLNKIENMLRKGDYISYWD